RSTTRRAARSTRSPCSPPRSASTPTATWRRGSTRCNSAPDRSRRSSVPTLKHQPVADMPVGATTSEALEIRDLSFAYEGRRGHNRVLDNVTLDVEQGEFICLIGPSGCGKTSLLRILAGLEKPVDRKMLRWPGKHPRAGFIFQARSVFPWMTV